MCRRRLERRRERASMDAAGCDAGHREESIAGDARTSVLCFAIDQLEKVCSTLSERR